MPNPEPPSTVRPPVPSETGPADEESPTAPAIPSFASLRAPRGRSAVDLLLPGAAPAPSVDLSAPAPRPAEYADLVRFGIRLARRAAAVPLRVAGRAVRGPTACLRRVFGGQVR